LSDEPLDVVETRPKLGAASIIGEATKLYFRGFLFFFPVVLIAATAFEVAVYQFTYYLGESAIMGAVGMRNDLVLALINLWLEYPLQGLVVLPAIYLFREGRLRLGSSFAGILRSFIAVLALGLLGTALTMFGYFLLIVPGVIVSLALFPLVPVIQMEKRGLSAIERCFELTQNYRMPIFGLAILVGILVGGSTLLFSAIADPVYLWIDNQDPNDGLVETVFYSTVAAATYTIAGPIAFISAALTYLRLIDIKESGGEDQLLKIFE
jgi:hypothetical protein